MVFYYILNPRDHRKKKKEKGLYEYPAMKLKKKKIAYKIAMCI